jgi:hypothetical protein
VVGCDARYGGARIDSWRLPSSETKRKELADYGTDALHLLQAVFAAGAPGWLA